MKKIAITPRIEYESSYKETRDAIDIKWIELMQKAGCFPIIIPTGVKISSFVKFNKIDGIIFTGGNDLSSLDQNHISELRDKKEEKILKYAIDNYVPVLGVCRGAQFIAEYFGSTLEKVHYHIGAKHKIILKNDFWGSQILKDYIYVNSFHQYGIRSLSAKLISVVESEDGLIEAFYSKKYKIFGQMWHPEREKPFVSADINLIENFFT